MVQDSHTWGQVEPDHKSLEFLVPPSAPLICIPIAHAFQLVCLFPLARLHLILLSLAYGALFIPLNYLVWSIHPTPFITLDLAPIIILVRGISMCV